MGPETSEGQVRVAGMTPRVELTRGSGARLAPTWLPPGSLWLSLRSWGVDDLVQH